MSTAGPCERTMIWLRGLGYTVDKVEQRVPHSARTRDFMGFADILGIGLGPGVLAVQATTNSHLSEHIAKVLAEPRAKLWRACDNRLWVVGWAERRKGARTLWVPRVVKFSMMMEPCEETLPFVPRLAGGEEGGTP